MEKKTIIFDLDGTLALVDKRVQKSMIPKPNLHLMVRV